MHYYHVTAHKWNSKIILLIPSNDQLATEAASTTPLPTSPTHITQVITTLETDSIRTLHVYVHESILPDYLPILIAQDYCFRRYHKHFYCYYKWLLATVPDKVHPYATSTAGASTMILDPTQRSTCLIHENDMWKFVTGSNDFNETSLQTALREMKEEVNLDPNPAFKPQLIGMWNIGGRTDDKINDVMVGYVVVAAGTDVTLDPFEVGEFKWFELDDPVLCNAIAKAYQVINDGTCDVTYRLEVDGVGYCLPHLLWLGNWLSGKVMGSVGSGKMNVWYWCGGVWLYSSVPSWNEWEQWKWMESAGKGQSSVKLLVETMVAHDSTIPRCRWASLPGLDVDEGQGAKRRLWRR